MEIIEQTPPLFKPNLNFMLTMSPLLENGTEATPDQLKRFVQEAQRVQDRLLRAYVLKHLFICYCTTSGHIVQAEYSQTGMLVEKSYYKRWDYKKGEPKEFLFTSKK